MKQDSPANGHQKNATSSNGNVIEPLAAAFLFAFIAGFQQVHIFIIIVVVVVVVAILVVTVLCYVNDALLIGISATITTTICHDDELLVIALVVEDCLLFLVRYSILLKQ